MHKSLALAACGSCRVERSLECWRIPHRLGHRGGPKGMHRVEYAHESPGLYLLRMVPVLQIRFATLIEWYDEKGTGLTYKQESNQDFVECSVSGSVLQAVTEPPNIL
jgi:hypothetical protein